MSPTRSMTIADKFHLPDPRLVDTDLESFAIELIRNLASMQEAIKWAIRQSVSARIYCVTDQGIATGNPSQVVTFSNALWDDHKLWDNPTNPGRLVARQPGRYYIEGYGVWDINGTGSRRLDLRLNGTTIIKSDSRAAFAVSNMRQSVNTVYELRLNDYVQLLAWQDSTVTVPLLGNTEGGPMLAMHLLSGL